MRDFERTFTDTGRTALFAGGRTERVFETWTRSGATFEVLESQLPKEWSGEAVFHFVPNELDRAVVAAREDLREAEDVALDAWTQFDRAVRAGNLTNDLDQWRAACDNREREARARLAELEAQQR
jgi:hypothetical protein